MSGWRPILERELNEIKKIKYSKINCILQDIADKFQREGLSKLEVALINMAIVNKEMLNEKNAESFYRSRWDLLLKSEGMDEIEKLKADLKREQECVDFYANRENWSWVNQNSRISLKTDQEMSLNNTHTVAGKLARLTQQQRREG